jgi:prepilin-type N-terminal cleavage/methylation domain-containing protein
MHKYRSYVKDNHTGFTLIELIIVMLIIAIILSAGIGTYAIAQQGMIKENLGNSVKKNGDLISAALAVYTKDNPDAEAQIYPAVVTDGNDLAVTLKNGDDLVTVKAPSDTSVMNISPVGDDNFTLRAASANSSDAITMVYDSATGAVSSQSGEQLIASGSVVPDDSSSTTTNTESSPIDIPWGIIGLVLLGIAGLVGAGFAGTYGYKKQATTRHTVTQNKEQWLAVEAQHQDVLSSWADYEMDIIKVIDYPTMTDMTDPKTIALHAAIRRAALAKPTDKNQKRTYKMSSAIGTEYADAVQALHTAFLAAESNAKKVSWSGFTAQERRQLSQAKDLLAMAYNTSASPSERQSAYKQAMKRLEGLIVPPQQAILAIEQRMPILIEQ